jgi:hypothetical protein
MEDDTNTDIRRNKVWVRGMDSVRSGEGPVHILVNIAEERCHT